MKLSKQSKTAAKVTTSKGATKGAATVTTKGNTGKAAIVPASVPKGALWVVIGTKGTSVPPYLQGKTAAQIEALGLKPNAENSIQWLRAPAGVPIETVSLENQPLWMSAHAWISKRTENFGVYALQPAVAKGLVTLGKFWTGNTKTAEIGVFPKGWNPSLKLPQVLGVLPSATYQAGRLENKRVGDRNSEVLGKVHFAEPTAKTPKAAKVEPTKAEPKKRGAMASLAEVANAIGNRLKGKAGKGKVEPKTTGKTKTATKAGKLSV